jgi:ABC-type Fe3+/spermidine/putrescine transport system ATPase subunit
MSDIWCSGLTVRFGETAALDGVSCEAPAGGVLLVLGPSGAGKSTLLRVIAGLLKPRAGIVRIGDETATGPGVLVAPHRRGLSFVFQRPTLWPHMTVLDNVALALVGRGARRRERRRAASEALAELGLTGCDRLYPGTLSGGELQRVALARSLVTHPRVLLLDEPLTGLDPELRRDFAEKLGRLKATGMTMIWVSHQCEEAYALADRLLLLRKGKVEEHGEVQAVLSRPRTAFSATFLTGANLVPGAISAPGRARTALGEIECSAGQPGDAVLFAVPPSRLALSANGGVAAEVVRSEFRGDSFMCIVKVNGLELRLISSERLNPGQKVALDLVGVPPVVT